MLSCIHILSLPHCRGKLCFSSRTSLPAPATVRLHLHLGLGTGELPGQRQCSTGLSCNSCIGATSNPPAKELGPQPGFFLSRPCLDRRRRQSTSPLQWQSPAVRLLTFPLPPTTSQLPHWASHLSFPFILFLCVLSLARHGLVCKPVLRTHVSPSALALTYTLLDILVPRSLDFFGLELGLGSSEKLHNFFGNVPDPQPHPTPELFL